MNRIVLASLAALLGSSAFAAPVTYTLDPNRTFPSFAADHFGAVAVELTKADPAQHERDHAFPSMLPDGHTVLFTIVPTGPIENAQVAVLDLKTGQKKTLTLPLAGKQLAYWDTRKQRFVVEDDKIQIMVGSSSADTKLSRSVQVVH